MFSFSKPKEANKESVSSFSFFIFSFSVYKLLFFIKSLLFIFIVLGKFLLRVWVKSFLGVGKFLLRWVEFFSLTNHSWMSIILAFAFEVGQAAVLLAILTSAKDRSKFTPWILMCILTLVQIIGNVYSSYKYIMLNASENLRYFKEPIFIWTDLPDAQATVIITYISSAILPLCALLLTSMITNYLEDNGKDDKKETITEEEVDKETDEEIQEEKPEEEIEDKPEEENINESHFINI